MKKKVRSRGRAQHKVHPHQAVSSSPRVKEVSKQVDPEAEVDDVGVEDGGDCEHYDKNDSALNRFLLRIRSLSLDARCENCRDKFVGTRRGNKGKGKGSKKKGGSDSVRTVNSEVIWVCLNCGHLGCGGHVNDSVPYGHARHHSKEEHHLLAARLDKPSTGWCFQCVYNIRIEMPEVPKVKPKSTSDVGDGWTGGDDTGSCKKADDTADCLAVYAGKRYAIRGLMNLGNTCFLNSVMQNLFATDMLREYFSSLTEMRGPLTMALKKLFSETSVGMETNKGVVNPKNFFGCICSKAPQFKGYQQQDSHELLRYLLDGLCMEESSARKSQGASGEDKVALQGVPTFVDIIFGGQLSSTVCCVECGHSSVVHEPFLDLSLPVPSKKVLPKKVSATSLKNSKSLPREVPKGRRTRERGSVKILNFGQRKSETVESFESTKQNKMQSACSSSESGGSYCSPAYEQEQIVSLPEENALCWLDYVEPTVTPENVHPISDKKENLDSESSKGSVLKDSELEKICQSKGDVSVPVLVTDDPSKTQAVTLELSVGTNVVQLQPQDIEVESSAETRDIHLQIQDAEVEYSGETIEVPSKVQDVEVGSSGETNEVPLQVQDADVLLLPYTELTSTAKETSEAAGETQKQEDDEATNGILVQKSSNAASTSVACEPAEVEFDGLGDLFAEPEITSVPRNEKANVEDTEASWLFGDNSESNQEEVDNTDAPVSVVSCLAYFTKPELLSDEHAWHCENCSRILQNQTTENWKSNQQGIQCDNLHEPLHSAVDAHKVINNIDTFSLDGNTVGCSENETLEKGKFTTSVGNIVSDMEDCRNAKIDANTSKNPLGHTLSDSTMCKSKQTTSEKSSDQSNFPENCCEVSEKDGDIVGSDTSQYFSCTSNVEKICSKVNSSCVPDSNLCCRDELNDDACEVELLSLVSSPHSIADTREEDGVNTCGNDTCADVQKVKKKKVKKNGKRTSNKVLKNEESEPEKLKVKRDATKRILINKAPPILTIHLKRFSQDGRGRLNKLNGHVVFQEVLDLAPYMDPRSHRDEVYSFRLVGVIEHSGNMKGGHYIAYVRGEKGRRDGNSSSTWFYTSDAHVREVSLAEVLQSEAYILFYERIQH